MIAGKTSLFERIYDVLRAVPPGRVTTYGQIAWIVGCSARSVGFAMASVTEESGIPWYRVINSKGKISLKSGADEQRSRLEAEGIQFDENDRVDLTVCLWDVTNPD